MLVSPFTLLLNFEFAYFMSSLKYPYCQNVQTCHHFGPPFTPVFPWFGMSCDVDSGASDLRLDSFRLFFLCKFSLVVHTKCWKGAFCMDNEAKFTEGKTSEISQAWSHTFLNLRNNSEHVNIVISATGRPQENWIFRFLNIHKKSLYSGSWSVDKDKNKRRAHSPCAKFNYCQLSYSYCVTIVCAWTITKFKDIRAWSRKKRKRPENGVASATIYLSS